MSLLTNSVAFWNLDKDSTDHVGTNNGSDTDIVYDSGLATFNGTSSKITIGNTGVTGSSAFTFSCVASTIVNAGTKMLFSFGAAATKQGYSVYKDFNNNLRCNFFGGGGSGHGSTDIHTGAMFHLVASFDGSVTTLYVNGQSDGVSVAVTGNNLGTGANFIGIDQAQTAADFWNGRIKSIGLWSRALSAPEVAQLWNGGLVLQSPFNPTGQGFFNSV